MTRSLSITLCICAASLSVALFFVSWRLTVALDTAHMALYNLSALAYSAAPTVQHVNTATDVWAKASQKQADAADALLRDLRVISWHLDRSFLKLDTVLDTSNEQIKHIGPLLDSVKKSSDAIPGTLDHVNRAVDASTGAIRASQRVADDFHAKLTDGRVDALLNSFRGMAESGNGILADGRIVADKAAKDYISPRPWYRKVGRYASDAFDIGALIARHY